MHTKQRNDGHHSFCGHLSPHQSGNSFFHHTMHCGCECGNTLVSEGTLLQTLPQNVSYSLVYYLTVSAHIFESTKFFADELNLIWPDKSLRCIAICIGRSAAILLQSESREAKPSQLTILVVEIGGWSYLWRRERGRHCQREWKEADLRKGRKRDKETPFWWKGEAELTLHSLLSDLTLQPDMLFRGWSSIFHPFFNIFFSVSPSSACSEWKKDNSRDSSRSVNSIVFP